MVFFLGFVKDFFLNSYCVINLYPLGKSKFNFLTSSALNWNFL